MKPYAAWTPDCQGKQDFDGSLISVSTRYWPGPSDGGFMTVTSSGGRVPKISIAPYGAQPSAHSAIHLRLGPPEKGDGGGDYLVWREEKFSAATEVETKALVEAWVARQMVEIVALLGGVQAFSAP